MDSHPPIMWKMLNVTAPYNEAETEMELAEGEKKKKSLSGTKRVKGVE